MAWGLFGDRSKGRPRCPRCWYDMTGAKACVCSECGHDAIYERRLYKNRRCWLPILFGAALMVVGGLPLTAIFGWHREQATIQAIDANLSQRRGPPALTSFAFRRPVKSGPRSRVKSRLVYPTWLVEHLPSRFHRYTHRAFEVTFNNTVTDEVFSHVANFRHLQRIRFTNSEVTGLDLRLLGELKNLNMLQFWSIEFRDRDMEALAHVSNLEWLRIYDTKVSDQGLVHIRHLRKLKSLMVDGSEGVSDAGLVHLRGLKDLRRLSLSRTRVSGSGLAHLPHPENLVLVGLDDTPTTDQALAHLKTASDLKYLFLSGTNVTDRGLVHLRDMSKLESLTLGSRVTDAGLKHLHGLVSLTHLNVSTKTVTFEGIAEVRRVLPNLRVTWN